MPALIDPTTRSPGHIYLRYSQLDIEHTMSCRLVGDIWPESFSTLQDDADNWAAAMGLVMSPAFNLYGWGLRDNDGHNVYESPLSSVVTGELSAYAGVEWKSTTLTALGRGTSLGAEYASGRALFRWYVGSAFIVAVGEKALYSATDSHLAGLQTFLNTNLNIFADFYGQKATCGGKFPFQYNAHAQRKHGA